MVRCSVADALDAARDSCIVSREIADRLFMGTGRKMLEGAQCMGRKT